MQNKGYIAAVTGVLFSLVINVAILFYVFGPSSTGFDIFTSLSGFFWTGIALIPLIIWALVCKHVFKYSGNWLNWILLPSFVMIVFYILVPFLPID